MNFKFGNNVITENTALNNLYATLIWGEKGSGITSLLTSFISHLKSENGQKVQFNVWSVKDSTNYSRILDNEDSCISSIQEIKSKIQYLQNEIQKRTELFKAQNVSDLETYNTKTNSNLPYIFIVIDGLTNFEDKEIYAFIYNCVSNIKNIKDFGIKIVCASETYDNIIDKVTLNNIPLKIALKDKKYFKDIELANPSTYESMLQDTGDFVGVLDIKGSPKILTNNVRYIKC